MIKSTFMGIKKRVKERPDLSYLFMSSADYGSWGRQGSTQKTTHLLKTKQCKTVIPRRKGDEKSDTKLHEEN